VEAYLRHGGGLIGYDPNPLLPPHIQTQIQAGKKTQNPWKISFKMNVQSQGILLTMKMNWTKKILTTEDHEKKKKKGT